MSVIVLASLLASSRQDANYKIERDSYAVPIVRASSVPACFEGLGAAVAEDRLWQMEMSRRSARGRLSEILGSKAVASDRAVLLRAYTDDELASQIKSLPQDVQDDFQAYAVGVNATISKLSASGSLPPGYAKYGFKPEPWTTLDSAAIGVALAREFGTGGAGALRNVAFLRYLRSQKCKDKYLDVFDDIAFPSDPDSPTTVKLADDLSKDRPAYKPTPRSVTEAQFSALPNTNLLELAGGLAEADETDTKLLAESLSVPFHVGSYAVVVSPSRSASGIPILMGCPQMGHTVPSVVHEAALEARGFAVAGMDVPGLPGIAIGYTPKLAWTLTSGVADIEDIFYSKLTDASDYTYGTDTKPLEKVVFKLPVKGGDSVEVTQERTLAGPVILKSNSSHAAYSLKSSLAGRELGMVSALIHVPQCDSAPQIDASVAQSPATFNVFYAMTSGDIGWRYAGKVPVRADGLDPRLPTPLAPETLWKGELTPDQMPHTLNPSTGLIYNWNNKSTPWWPNLDTPVWGSIFRSSVLGESLNSEKLTVPDVEKAAWDIARKDTETDGAFAALFKGELSRRAKDRQLTDAEKQLMAFNGWEFDGSVPAAIYREAVRQLRRQLFLADCGNLTNEGLFNQVFQPSVMLKALQGKTKYNYLAGRKPSEVAGAAIDEAVKALTAKLGPDVEKWGIKAGAFPVGDMAPVAYSNRGTYMQVIELSPQPFGRNVVVPGEAESGPHASDQVELSRTWLYKPMWRPGQ